MKKFLLLTAAAFLGFTSGVQASSCYTPEQAEAEQGIRIHSELLVIGLNCQHMRKAANDQNLYVAYRHFTKKYEQIFVDYERRILDYYKDIGHPDPDAALKTLRTNFANRISGDVAKMRPDVFCSRHAERMVKAATFNEQQIRQWAGTFHASHPVSMPICEGS